MGEEIAFQSFGHLFYVLSQEHPITLLAVLWGMAINANMHRGITWPYSVGMSSLRSWPAGMHFALLNTPRH